MKAVIGVLVCLLLAVSAAFAADIDGKWYSERKMERDGQSFTIANTFDLKAEGSKLTGTMSMKFGDMEPPKMEIQDGKIDGNKFSFLTVMETPNGTMKVTWSGTVEGTTLKGTSEREGGQSRPFEAKKQ